MNIAALSGRAGRNILLIAAVLFFGIPLVWLLLAPTKTYSELLSTAPLSFGNLQNVGDAWEHIVAYKGGIIFRWIGNSVIYTVLGSILPVLFAVPAGYGLAKFRFRGRSTILFTTLVMMIVPSAALILPLYLELSALRLTNTMWAVILPSVFYPFGVYLIYLFAANSIPDSIIEAARIDGASELRILLGIFVPLARPAIVMVFFFAFVGAWNSFFLPYIMLTGSDLANLQVGLSILVVDTGALTGINFGVNDIHAPEIALASIVSVLPILLIFIFAQRHLVAGQTAAAEKG